MNNNNIDPGDCHICLLLLVALEVVGTIVLSVLPAPSYPSITTAGIIIAMMFDLLLQVRRVLNGPIMVGAMTLVIAVILTRKG